jgi:hypothetical protein
MVRNEVLREAVSTPNSLPCREFAGNFRALSGHNGNPTLLKLLGFHLF